MSSSKLETYDSVSLVQVLGVVPSQDWQRSWPFKCTGILRLTSTDVKRAIDTNIKPLTYIRMTKVYDTVKRKEDFINLLKSSKRLNITTLILAGCAISDFEQLGKTLNQCEYLVTLNLSKNNLGDNGLKTIAKFFTSFQLLIELDLSLNNIGVLGIKNLTGVLGQYQGLRHVNFFGNQLGDEGVGIFVDAIAGCPKIASIVLSANNIGPKGITRLLENITNWPKLNNLNLCFNQIGPEGIKILTAKLPGCVELSSINLASNQIGPEGIKDLASMLSICNLANLDISYNKFGNDGIAIFANTLEEASSEEGLSLKVLNLSGNNIGDDGLDSIGIVLLECPKLKWLKLDDNLISDIASVILTNVLSEDYPELVCSHSSNSNTTE